MKTKKGTGKATAKITAERRFVSDLIKKSVSLACREISDMPSPWGISTGIRPAKEARQMLDEGKTDIEILSFLEQEMWITEEKALLSLSKIEKNAAKDSKTFNFVSRLNIYSHNIFGDIIPILWIVFRIFPNGLLCANSLNHK